MLARSSLNTENAAFVPVYLKMSSADALWRERARHGTRRWAGVGRCSGPAAGAGLQPGCQRPAVLSFGECFVLVLWACSTRAQVNLKPIIRKAIWMPRIDEGAIRRVVIVKSITSQRGAGISKQTRELI